METIVLGKGKGKTTKLIKKSFETGNYIVCYSLDECNRIQGFAKEIGYNIPLPITYNEFLNKKYCGYNINGFLFDNVDMFLQSLTNVIVNCITVSSETKLTEKRKYWYRDDVYVCVLCGVEKHYRKRVYNINEKGVFYHDNACDTHFL